VDDDSDNRCSQTGQCTENGIDQACQCGHDNIGESGSPPNRLEVTERCTSAAGEVK